MHGAKQANIPPQNIKTNLGLIFSEKSNIKDTIFVS